MTSRRVSRANRQQDTKEFLNNQIKKAKKLKNGEAIELLCSPTTKKDPSSLPTLVKKRKPEDSEPSDWFSDSATYDDAPSSAEELSATSSDDDDDFVSSDDDDKLAPPPAKKAEKTSSTIPAKKVASKAAAAVVIVSKEKPATKKKPSSSSAVATKPKPQSAPVIKTLPPPIKAIPPLPDHASIKPPTTKPLLIQKAPSSTIIVDNINYEPVTCFDRPPLSKPASPAPLIKTAPPPVATTLPTTITANPTMFSGGGGAIHLRRVPKGGSLKTILNQSGGMKIGQQGLSRKH